MSSFAGATFWVYADDRDHWPLPEPDDQAVYHYRARVRADSAADYATLIATYSILEWRRGEGTLLKVFTIKGGTGVGTLTVPIEAGVLGSGDAVLIGYKPVTNGHVAGRFECDLHFVLTDDALVAAP